MYQLKKGQKVALMLGPLMGDGIVSMCIAKRIQEEGCKVVVFSDHLYALRALYPKFEIRKFGKHPKKDSAGFDLLLYPHQKQWPYYGHQPRKEQTRVTFREHKSFYQLKPIKELYQIMMKELFGIEMSQECPVTLPKGVKKGKFEKRIVIHPTASERFKEWSKKQFLELANRIEKEGFEPVFVVAPGEDQNWGKFTVACFKDLMDLAVFLCESTFFIGSDSGPGHLAAALGTPTLTLFVRKKIMIRWAPTSEREAALLPWLHLPGHRLKSIYWRGLISPKRCFRRFQKLYVKNLVAN